MDELTVVSKLLQIDAGSLGKALVSQRKMMGKESILTVKSRVFAESARDALTKKVYSNMFNWLIQRINKTLGSKAAGANRTVGVLDIFGTMGLSYTMIRAQVSYRVSHSLIPSFCGLVSSCLSIHRFRNLQREPIRTAVHQLCKRKDATALQLASVEERDSSATGNTLRGFRLRV
jgi:hypothetical protein